jgi:hypothetical protein
MSPGSLGAGTAWLIAIVGACVAAVTGYVSIWGSIAVMGLACFAAAFMTKATKGAGVGIVFVSNILFTVLIALVIKSQADAVIADELAKSGETSALAKGAGETAGVFAMILGAAIASVPAFFVSLVGSLIGSGVRPKRM